jgi:hypothetical protein
MNESLEETSVADVFHLVSQWALFFAGYRALAVIVGKDISE